MISQQPQQPQQQVHSHHCSLNHHHHHHHQRDHYPKHQQEQQHYEHEHNEHHQQQQQQHSASVPVFNGIDIFYPGLQQIHCDPPIYQVEDFLTHEECDHLIHIASDSFAPAPVVGDGEGVVSATRTSSSCYLAREDVPTLCRKVEALTCKPICHMELPQVGRYLTTQQYLPHYDAFNLDEADGARFASNGGQRTVTVLVYLNDVSSGGHTAFPHLAGAAQNQHNNQNNDKEHSDDHNDSDNSDNHTTTTSGSPSQQRQQLEVRPTRGTALVFFPATVDGHLDPRTLHAALPAVDTKFVSQIWIRQGNYYGQATKRLSPSLIMGAPPLTPQETQAYPHTTMADVLQRQQQQQLQQYQQHQQQQQQQQHYHGRYH